MIEKLEVTGVHLDIDDKLHKYVTKKIGKLDRYISKHARESAHAEVKLRESKVKDKKDCTCEVVMHLPHDVFTVKETTMNMYAAVDIVEAKLKNQLKRYKEKHATSNLARRYSFRLWRRDANPATDADIQ